MRCLLGRWFERLCLSLDLSLGFSLCWPGTVKERRHSLKSVCESAPVGPMRLFPPSLRQLLDYDVGGRRACPSQRFCRHAHYGVFTNHDSISLMWTSRAGLETGKPVVMQLLPSPIQGAGPSRRPLTAAFHIRTGRCGDMVWPLLSLASRVLSR